MCRTTRLIYMFILHMYYMCRNTSVYSTHVLHVHNMCFTYVSAKQVIHMFYTYNIP